MKFNPDGMPYEQKFGEESANERADDNDTFDITGLNKQPYVKRMGLQQPISYYQAKTLDLISLYKLITNDDDSRIKIIPSSPLVFLDGNRVSVEGMIARIKRKIDEIQRTKNTNGPN